MKRWNKKRIKVICPYCNKPAKFVDSKVVYGRSYGMIYLCEGCDAYVGTHPDGSPKGTPANVELRQARVYAHQSFDRLWKERLMRRSEAYAWLAEKMGISPDKCHIAMFDEKQCWDVVGLSDAYYFEKTLGA